MKQFFLVITTLLSASCSLDLGREELALDLPAYFTELQPVLNYRMTGGSHLQGYIRLYQAGEEGVSVSSLPGYDTLIPFPSGSLGQFRFRRDLSEGAYLIRSDLAVNRGGTVSLLLGSSSETYFSIIPRTDRPLAKPEWKVVTEPKTGRLLLRLVHPLRLDAWSGNPVVFHGTVTQSPDPGLAPAEALLPGNPDGGLVWDERKESQVFRNYGTGEIFRWIKAQATARMYGSPLVSTVAEFEHRYSLNLSNVKYFDQPWTGQSLRKSDASTVIRMTPEWTVEYGADGSPLPPQPEPEVLITLVNLSDGSTARIPLNQRNALGARNRFLPLASGGEMAVDIRGEDLRGLSTMGVNPNCELILTINDKATGGFPIHVAE